MQLDLSVYEDNVQEIVDLAVEEARRVKHNYVGTEHLLLGMTRTRDSQLTKLLERHDVSLKRVRDAVEFIIGKGDREVPEDLGLTPRAQFVCVLALSEAKINRSAKVNSLHLLSGLLREGEGIAVGVLESLGVIDLIKRDLKQLLLQDFQRRSERGETMDEQPTNTAVEQMVAKLTADRDLFTQFLEAILQNPELRDEIEERVRRDERYL